MKRSPQNDLRQHYHALLGLEAPWQVQSVEIDLSAKRVEIILDHPGAQPLCCPKCAQPMSRHDGGSVRTWRHLDTMAFETLVSASAPRGRCAEHGVLTVAVPWAGRYSRCTWLLEEFVITILQIGASLEAVSRFTALDWHTLKQIEARAVERGMARRQAPEADQLPPLPPPRQLGIDEKSFGKGQHYVSVAFELGPRARVLEVVEGRTQEAAKELLCASVPECDRALVEEVAMDLAAAFKNAAREVFPKALVTHDRWHLETLVTRAVDQVRRAENKAAQAQGERGLNGTRWWWNYKQKSVDTKFSDEGKEAFALLMRQFKVVARAWQRKEMFGQLFAQPTRAEGERFFDRWCRSAMRSRLEPLKKLVATLRKHREGILNYFKSRISTAVCEGYNAVIETMKKNARGFRRLSHFRDRILFHLGRLDLRTPATVPAVRGATA